MDFVALALVAVVIQKIIERLRESLPTAGWLDGWRVNLLASVLGLIFAFAGHVEVFANLAPDFAWPWWLDQAITGIGLGAGAGWFSDIAGRSGT